MKVLSKLVAVWFTLICVTATAQEGINPIAYQQAVAERIRNIAEEILPSVVSIEVIGVLQSDGEVRQDAPTCGVIVDSDGFILASSWVVRSEAASIIVSTGDGNRYPAKVVGRDEHRDLVLLKIDAKGAALEAIELTASQTSPPIGSTLVALARYGESNVPIISSGVMSAVDRLDGTAIQSDVRISPTFYGGPLLDLNGNVAGILIPAVGENGADDPTAWYDSGIAFAVPTDVIAAKLKRLRDGETIQAGLLGLVIGGSDPYAPGTTIATLRKRSPADRSGLQAGDELTRVGDRPVRRQQEIKLALGRYDAGDEVELEVKRDGRSKVVVATLVDAIEPLRPQSIGVALEGLKVASILPDSPADGLIQVGDEIESLDRTKLPNAATLRQQLWAADPETKLTFGVRRLDDSTKEEPKPAPENEISITPKPWSGEFSTTVIESLGKLPATGTGQSWEATEIRLPDVVNQAYLWHPARVVEDAKETSEQGAKADPTGSTLSTGLAIVLLPPSQRDVADAMVSWKQTAKSLNVAVCLIASQDEQRWSLSEIDAISKITAAAIKQSAADPNAVAVVSAGILSTQTVAPTNSPNEAPIKGKANPADAMALAVSLSTENIYQGVAIPSSTQPPGIRLRRDAPMRLLRVLITGDVSEMPPWTETLTRIGCPVQTFDETIQQVDRRTVLSWCRSLLFL
ncbi:trypsin-like peptidase domain-containing protein [Neorhodopirellula pilleata]|uniref:Putative periplasmic serine endoprotease DegP-like n=1 Tax=Neorhodopirellula pilleata TaxID=2714738 RepID=A0A5C5ZM07_9BACT|nr:trypsin-like peptidase domain-containing protein [Neorhodopirellula pilleata]TWT88017.1 putative periplasmic serine endoprotease DegP-like precursor [Neorhodopirellula pilleata]